MSPETSLGVLIATIQKPMATNGLGYVESALDLISNPRRHRVDDPKGAKAPRAAGVIHTDFEKGFIKAEVISFADLVALGSVAEARAKGKARLEGKDYVMQDGDVVESRFDN